MTRRMSGWQVLEQEGQRLVDRLGINNVVVVDDKHDRVRHRRDVIEHCSEY